jgi:hypothetical protein
MARPFAVLLTVLLLVAGCDDSAPPPAAHSARPSPATPPAAFDPPAGQRWAGLHRVVVAVPAGWRSIENPFCQQPPTHTVVYFNPLNVVGACPYLGGRGPRRSPTYLTIEPLDRVTRADTRGTRPVDLAGVRAYAWNHPNSRYGQSAGLLVPSEHTAFYIHTSRARQARRILSSATAVPRQFRVIPKPAYASRHLSDMMRRIRARGLRPTYAEAPPGHTVYGYPGRFLRTDPPVGSVVERGSRVTAYFSSGRLVSWITPQRLAAQRWSVRPPASFTPPVDRTAALARLGRGPNERAAFLRTLTIDGHARLAWLVVDRPHYAYPGQAVSIAAVDARTGRLWRAPVPFPATVE